MVIDYKTGKPDQHHRQQLEKYSELLTGMHYVKVKKYLLYLEPEVNLVEV